MKTMFGLLSMGGFFFGVAQPMKSRKSVS